MLNSNTGINLNAAITRELVRIVGEDGVLTSPMSLEAYAYDSSPFYYLPDVVVFPRSTAEVSQVLTLAARHNIPVIPRGAGTNLSGGSIPPQGGMVVVLTRMNRILDVDYINGTALVEAGVINLDLQKEVEPAGYMFAPDPASQKVATIGGNAAECAGGIRGVKYGVTRDHILGLKAVLPGGAIITTGDLAPAGCTALPGTGRALAAYGLGPVDRVPAPDLTGILVGSEGTLAIISELLVRLTRKPEDYQTILAVFDSLERAGNAVSQIIARGIIPPTLEIMDGALTRAVDDFIQLGLPRDAEAILLIEVDGFQAEIERQVQTIAEVLHQNQVRTFRTAADAAERENLWLGRRSANGALGRIKPSYMVQDVTVPRDRLPEMLRRVTAIGEQHGVTIAQLAHAGDGNLHPHLLYDPRHPEEYHRVEAAARDIFIEALAMEGTLTGEHGIGMEKLEFMSQAFSPADLAFMAGVKQAFDPAGLLNPGKVIPPVPVPERLSTVTSSGGCTLSPGGEVEPETVADLVAYVRAAAQTGSPLLPVGGGTCLASTPAGEAGTSRVLTRRLNRVLELRRDNLSLELEAGVTLAAIREVLRDTGLCLPMGVRLPERSTVGGMIARNAISPKGMRYGWMRDHLLGVSFVSPTGELIRAGGKNFKNVSGYDVTRLMAGSWGALGVITGAVLRLRPLPEAEALFTIAHDELAKLAGAVDKLLKSDVSATGIHLMPAAVVKTANLPSTGEWLLVLGVEGSREALERHLVRVQDLTGLPVEVQEDTAALAAYWQFVAAQGEELAVTRLPRSQALTAFLQGMNQPGASRPAWLDAGTGRLLYEQDAWLVPETAEGLACPALGNLLRRIKNALDPAAILAPWAATKE